MNIVTVSYDEWLRGRAARRAAAVRISPSPLTRATGDDEILRSFDGERAAKYPSMELLQSYANAPVGAFA